MLGFIIIARGSNRTLSPDAEPPALCIAFSVLVSTTQYGSKPANRNTWIQPSIVVGSIIRIPVSTASTSRSWMRLANPYERFEVMIFSEVQELLISHDWWKRYIID